MTNEEALRLRRDLARQITAIGNDSTRAAEKDDLLNIHKALSSWKDGGLPGEPPTVVARWIAGLPAEARPAATPTPPPALPVVEVVEVVAPTPPVAPLTVPVTIAAEVPSALSEQEQRAQITRLFAAANEAVNLGQRAEARRQLQEILSLTENAQVVFKTEHDQAATRLRELESQTLLNSKASQLGDLKRRLVNLPNKLTTLEDQIAEARSLLKTNEGDAELETLLVAAEHHRAQIQDRIGQINTLHAAEKLSQVITEWEQLLKEGITEVEVANAQTNTMIRMPIERALADVRYKYIEFCRRKGEEKRERARSLMPAQPAAALYEIDDALTKLTEMPGDMREDLERLQREYQSTVESYKRAEQSREAALLLLSSDPAAAFTQLQGVQGIYRDLPQLADDLARAEAAWGRQIDQQVGSILLDAERRIKQAHFAEAEGKIDEARVLLLLKGPANHVNRAALTQQISAVADSLDQRQSHAQHLAQQLAEIRQAIEQREYARADELLGGIAAEDANQEVNSLRATVAGARGPSDQLATAEQLLASGAVTTNYSAIADLLNKVLTGAGVPAALRSRATELKTTLETEHAYLEGMRLLDLGDGLAAQAQFNQVLTHGASARRAEGQAQVTMLKEQLGKQPLWDRWVTKAKKVGGTDDLRDMEDMIRTLQEQEAARNLYLPLRTAWDDTRLIYRDAAEKRIAKIQRELAPTERSTNPEHTQLRFDQLTEAKHLVDFLTEFELLDDYRLSERILLPWHRVQAQQNERLAALGTQPDINWQTARDNWIALGKVEPLNAALQEEVKTARRRVVQSWADQLKEDRPADALQVVAEALAEHGWASDSELLERAVILVILAARRQMEQQADAGAVLAQGYDYARRVPGSKRSDHGHSIEQAQEVNALVQEALEHDRAQQYRAAIEALNNAVQDYAEYAPDLARLRQTLAERGITRLKHETDELERRANQNLAPLLEKYALILLLVTAAPQSNLAKNVKKKVDERMLGLRQTLDSYRTDLLADEAELQATFSNTKKLQARTIESLRAEVDQLAEALNSLRAVDASRKDSPARDKDPVLRDIDAAWQNMLKYQRTLQQLTGKLDETERLLAEAVREDDGDFRAAEVSLEDVRTLCRGVGQLSSLGAITRLETRLQAEQTYWDTINQAVGAISDALRDHPDQIGDAVEQFREAQRASEANDGLRPNAGDKSPTAQPDRFAKIRLWQNSHANTTIDMIGNTDQLLEVGRKRAANIVAVKAWAEQITRRVRELDAQWKDLEDQERRPLEAQIDQAVKIIAAGEGLLAATDTNPAAESRSDAEPATENRSDIKPPAESRPAEKILDDVAKLHKRVEQIVNLARQWEGAARPKIKRIHVLKEEIPPLLNKKRYLECRPLVEEGLQLDPNDPALLAWKRTVNAPVRRKRGLFG
ncbi:MAG: hypothetical protein M3Z04_16285 [Chloroflexota bacterium]|nr:hypothetical protein [Chloroflexota bacterium]